MPEQGLEWLPTRLATRLLQTGKQLERCLKYFSPGAQKSAFFPVSLLLFDLIDNPGSCCFNSTPECS